MSFATAPVGTTAEIAHRTTPHDDPSSTLLGIATRMDRFLETVAARLGQVFDDCDGIQGQKAQILTQSSELQRDRSEWERKHQKEIARIHKECEQLADIWTRIEEQERSQMLGQRGQGQDAMPATGVSPAAQTNHQNGHAEPDPRVAVIKTGVDVPIQHDMNVEVSPAEILMQFQQLNRAIQNHARRNR